MKLAEIEGTRGRIAGAIIGVLAVPVGVFLMFSGDFFALLGGVLMVASGLYELARVFFKSDYELTITSGRDSF